MPFFEFIVMTDIVVATILPRSPMTYKNSPPELVKEIKGTELSVLGGGTFSEVTKFKSDKDGQVYALKTYRDEDAESGTPVGDEHKDSYFTEVRIHRMMRDSKYIVRLYAFDGEKKMLTEYMNMSLGKYITDTPTPLNKLLLASYSQQLLLGVKDLHDKGVYHCDLNVNNLVINRTGDLKIIDFSNSYILDKDKIINNRGKIEFAPTTATHCPPEFMMKCLNKLSGSDIKTLDIWSVGITLLQMIGVSVIDLLYSKPLFYAEEKSKGAKKYNKGRVGKEFCSGIFELVGYPTDDESKVMGYPKIVPIERQGPSLAGEILLKRKRFTDEKEMELFIDLVSRMLMVNPTKRISVVDAIVHPYFTNLNSKRGVTA